MPYLDDVYKELAEVESYIARRGRAEARAVALGPVGARRVNQIAARFPHLSPDAVVALGRAGVDPNSPLVTQVGRISAGLMLRDHPGGRRYGAPSVTPGQRRELTARQNIPASFNWQPQSGNPDADAAWNEARQAGLVSGGVLTEPQDDADKQDLYQRTLSRLAAAGEEVPVLVNQAGAGWRAAIARANPDTPAADAGFERNADRSEIIRRNANRIAYDFLSEPQVEQTHAPSAFTTGIAGGVLGRLPGDPARRPSGPQASAVGAGVSGGLREAVQGTFAGMNAPVQEIQGQVRNLYGATHGRDVDWWEAQSDLGIALTSGIDDMGGGFFVDPESAVAQERYRREAARGQIGGHNVTLGRWAADATPFATDSKPSLILSGFVDLGVQMADPTAWGLGKAGEVGQTRRLFQSADLAAEEGAGLIRGLRNVINGPSATAFLDSPTGVDRLRWVAGVSSPYEMWRGFNRKITMDFAAELADAKTPEAARALLEPQLGRSIREVATVDMPTRNQFGAQVSPAARRPTEMPLRGPIDAWDKDIVGHELEKWMHNASFTDAEIAARVDEVARASSPNDLNAAIRNTLRDADGILARNGVDSPRVRSRVLQLHEGANADASEAMRRAMTDQNPSWNGVLVNGVPQEQIPARLFVEHSPHYLTLPDARDIRRVQSRYARILAKGDTGELRVPWMAIDAIQNELWKPLQLVTRIAWPIRVIAEEQIRMAAAGYDSMFRHPLSQIAFVTGRRNTGDVLGDVITESNALKSALTRGHGGWVDRRMGRSADTVFAKANAHTREDYVHAWGSEVARVSGDPIAQHMARADSLDATRQWFNRGGGLGFKGDMAQMHPESFNTEDAANAYLESTVLGRLENAHGGNTTLMDVIRTGRFDGRDITDGTRLDRKFVNYLDSIADEFGPERVLGEIRYSVTGGKLKEFADWYDRAVDKMFGWLMSNPTNTLSRGPTFKQAYWREAERLLPQLDPEARAEFLANARAANLDGWRISNRSMKRLERTATRGDLTLDEMDLLAKAHGLEETRNLLYDLTRKGRTMDALRLIMPFGEAWKEVMTRWFGVRSLRLGEDTGLVWKNPKTVRRFQQLVLGARGEDFGEVMGAPEGEGFFWTDEFGQEVFIYPGSSFLTEHTLGVPVPLTGRVQGLSMFGTVMPGLGPVAQIPVGWFLSNKPGPQAWKEFLSGVLDQPVGPLGTVQEQVLPFGAVGAEDAGDITDLYNYAPAWMRTAMDFATGGDGNEQRWATSVMEVARYLRSTGRYGDSLADQQQLLEDAQFKARNLYLIKAIAGVAAPAAPDIEWMVENDRGGLIRTAALAAEYRTMQEDFGIDAGRAFLDKYGPDLHAVITTPLTTSSRIGTPMTRDGVEWVQAHPGIEDDLPHTYGLFAPEGGPDDLSIYRQELRMGDRVRLNPKTWVRLLSNSAGNMLWQQAVDQVGDSRTRAESAWLRDIADQIEAQYEGWGDRSGLLEGAETETMVDELYRAAEHPSIRGTDAGEGLRLYLSARDRAQAQAEAEGFVGFSDAQAMEATRVWLNDIAAQIIDAHPGFAPMWDFVFSREARTED